MRRKMVVVRHMIENDFQEILKHEKNIFPDESWSLEMIAGCYSPELCFVAHALEKNSVQGYIFAYNDKKNKKIYIMNLAVESDSRNQKIGTQLLEVVIQTAQLLYPGSNRINLEVKKDNKIARKLYEKFDFKFTSESVLQPGYDDMQRKLHQKLACKNNTFDNNPHCLFAASKSELIEESFEKEQAYCNP